MFLNDWKDDGIFQMVADFEGIYINKEEYYATECPYKNVEVWLERKQQMEKALKTFEAINILLASYTYENYSGDAFVLYEHDGNLYEVNGGHCSCYGLEGQWQPEETTVADLRHRVEKGKLGTGYGCNEFKTELVQVLNDLESKSTQ